MRTEAPQSRLIQSASADNLKKPAPGFNLPEEQAFRDRLLFPGMGEKQVDGIKFKVGPINIGGSRSTPQETQKGPLTGEALEAEAIRQLIAEYAVNLANAKAELENAKLGDSKTRLESAQRSVTSLEAQGPITAWNYPAKLRELRGK